MTLLSFLDRTKIKHIIVAGIAYVTVNMLANLLPFNTEIVPIINSAFEVVFSILISVFIFAIYNVSKKNNFVFTRTLFLLFLTILSWAIGDALYIYLLCAGIDPFMSMSDLFYIAASLLLIGTVLTIPGSQPPSHRRNMVFIEISILVLSAAVLFTIMILFRGKPHLSFDLLTLLMVFIYPVLDVLLIWIIIILYFAYPLKSSQKVLSILLVGGLCIFFSDIYYLISSIYAPLKRDYFVGIGYYTLYVTILLAALVGFKTIRELTLENKQKVYAFKSGNWIVFIPGVFLILFIGMVLVFVFKQSFILTHGVIILIVIIIILFILHQYMVIAENIRLTEDMRQINAQLEDKVNQRTAELSKANIELLDEMKEREKAEVHLARSNQDLALINRDKDKLFSILAHDLRSPLGSMMNLTELLAENINDFDEKELLEIIGTLNKSATQTFQLFNDLLAWSAVQMGRGEREKEIFALSEIISGNLIILGAEIDKKQLEIITQVNTSVMAYADRFAVQTVVRNLISNAVKFTPPQGNITIMAEQSSELVKVSISDNGVGISKEKQKKLFRIDTVSSSAGTEGEKGTGFGLLLCKDLVEKNGGKIWLESEIDKGSTFHFTLPVRENDIAETKEISASRIQTSYDYAAKITFTTMTGEINSTVLRSELSLIWSSSDYNADFSVLVDIRQASFVLDTNDIPSILEIFSAMPGNKKSRKFALLTATPQQVAFSTMFRQNIKTKYPFNVEIFSTYEAALNWLGV